MNALLSVDERTVRRRYPFAELMRPIGGLVEEVLALDEELGGPVFEAGTTPLGNLTMTFPHLSTALGTDLTAEPIGGAGADIDPEIAWVRAVVEAAERYAAIAYEDEEFEVASARALGDEALDFDRIPRCSDREYADPRCPLHPPDPMRPIRWVRGRSLIDGRDRYVPAVMTHLLFSPWASERFWNPISTGVAAHVDPIAALVSAINEVIERDAIAITWLARLSLPRLELDVVPPTLAPSLARLERSGLQQRFFDATSDLGVPTIYALQLADGHPRLAQFVSCATDFDPAAACAKTIREATPSRAALGMPYAPPSNVADFVSLRDGAVALGPEDRRGAFAFLLDARGRRPLSALAGTWPIDAAARLRWLIARLRALDMEAIAVDLTTEELRRVGLWAVRVVIPDLMPMSPIQRARFLGHPRLYGYPRSAGFGELDVRDVNQDPQPFA